MRNTSCVYCTVLYELNLLGLILILALTCSVPLSPWIMDVRFAWTDFVRDKTCRLSLSPSAVFPSSASGNRGCIFRTNCIYNFLFTFKAYMEVRVERIVKILL